MYFSVRQKLLLAAVIFAVSGIWLYSLHAVSAKEEMRSVTFSQEVSFSFPQVVYEDMQLWFRRQRIALATVVGQTSQSPVISAPVSTPVASPVVSYSPEVIYIPWIEPVTEVVPTPVQVPVQEPTPIYVPVTPVAQSVTSLESLIDTVKIEDTEDLLTIEEEEHYKNIMAVLFSKFPSDMVERLDFLTLRSAQKGSRGLAGANSMILRVGGKLSDKEITAVGVHEFGHIVDLGYLRGNTYAGASSFKDGSKVIYNDDKSLEFYTISWVNDKERISLSSEADFVSGYAKTDPFEDFAESFIMYVLHGKQFKNLAQGNDALLRKYTFMKEQIFGGKEFLSNTESLTLNYTDARPWDATLEKYNYGAYKELIFR